MPVPDVMQLFSLNYYGEDFYAVFKLGLNKLSAMLSVCNN